MRCFALHMVYFLSFMLALFSWSCKKATNIESKHQLQVYSDSLFLHETTFGKDSSYYQLAAATDSIINQYLEINGADSTYINAKYKLSKSLEEKSLKKVLHDLDTLLILSKEIDLGHLYASILNTKASILYKLGLYDESLPLYLKSIEIFEEYKDVHAYAYALNDVGNLYFQRSMFDLSMEYYSLARKGFEKFNKPEDRYYGLSVYENNLALIEVEKNDFEQAEKHFRKGLKYRLQANRLHLISDSYIYIGRTKNALGQIDSTMYYMYLAFQTDSAYQHTHEQIHSARNYAYYLSHVAKLTQKSFRYYRYALQLAKRYDIHNSDPLIFLGLGGYYALRYEADSANHYGWKAYAAATEQKQLRNQRRALNFLKGNYEYLEDYYQYSKVLELLIQLNEDKGIKDDGLKAQIQYEADLRRNEASLRSKEKRASRIIYALLMVIVGMLVFYSLFLIKSRNKIKLQEKKLDQALKQEKRLKEYQKDMTNMIIHDLKGPLNTIINCKSLHIDSSLDFVQQAGYQMDNLVMNILDVYKYEVTEVKLTKTEIDLQELIADSIVQLELLARNKRIEIDYPKEIVCKFDADKEMMLRVLVNLLSNAIKFSPSNDVVRLSISNPRPDQLRVGVSNKGPSIPLDKQREIFERYIHSESIQDKSIKSTGLGLTFCKIAIEAHQGEIGVISAPQEAVEFWFTLRGLIHYELGNTVRSASSFHPRDKFNQEEKEMLKPYAEQVSKYQVFDVSAINLFLSSIESDHQAIQKWKNQIKKAVFEINEELFLTLLSDILEETKNKQNE
jgi:signal transduction histidine kinase/tetratricopeptide (TPR) repeat protein